LRLPEIDLLARHRLGTGARVFDLGAHQCVVALIMSRVVGPNGHVLAIEANAHNAAAGEHNRRLNGVGQLEVVHGAVDQNSGTIAFNLGLNGQADDGSGAWGVQTVRSFSIDDLSAIHGFPDVLFLDVEGFEVRALRGASKTLARKPDCFVEVHLGTGLETFGGSVEEVLSFFPQTAYELFAASEPNREFVPITPTYRIPGERFFLLAIRRSA